MSANKRFGRWLLYSICLTPAVLMLGYYFLGYVPVQREYFMNLRFRALAIIGDQLRSKIENLATSLDYATKPGQQPDQYISALVPELNYLNRCVSGDYHKPSVEFGPNAVRFDSGRQCPAEASLSQLLSRFSREELFDDLVIAETGGRVIYQRSTSSPRIASLSELMKTTVDAKVVLREGTGTDADAVRSVRLDDSDYVLLLQPVRISMFRLPPAGLTVAGLVRSQRQAEEARHVPPKYLLVIFAPLAILLLSGPFLKILLLTRTGRLAIHDMALLSVFTLIATALVTVLLVSWHQYRFSQRQSESEMTQFAHSLNRRIAQDLQQVRSTLQRFDDALPPTIAQTADRDRTDLLAARLPLTTTDPIPFDFVFWTNADGCQFAKWTTKRFNTQRVDQTYEEHFQNVMARRFWSIAGDPNTKFTLQTLISPTTSQLIVVMAMPSNHPDIQVRGCFDDSLPSPVVSAAIVAPLPSLSAPLVPPGVGFAIIDPAGRVLFHSSPEHNLHENLFEEIRSPAPLRAAVAMRAGRSLPAYYRGRQYQFYLQPVTGLGGIPWTIAVFQAVEPRQAVMGLVWGETLALFLALLCLVAAGFLLLSLILSIRRNLSWRDQVDFILARIWPDPARRPVFRRLAWELGIMVLLSFAAILLGKADAYHSAWWLLPLCFLVPLSAMGLTAFRMWKPDLESCNVPPAGQRQHAYIACLSLLLVLLALVPNLGVFSICNAFETRLYLVHWQQELLNSVDARRSRLLADVEGSRALSDKAKAFIRENFLTPGEAAGGWDRQRYVEQFSQTRVTKVTRAGTGNQPGWWQPLMVSVRAETEANSLETGVLARSTADSSSCQSYQQSQAARPELVLKCAKGSAMPVEISSTLPETTLPSDPLWWAVALALLGGAYAWNCLAFCRLFNLDFNYIDLPLLTEIPAPAAVQGHLMVLGLPLARKDAAVRRWLGYTAPRVNLYEESFTEGWRDLTCARLNQELRAISGKTMHAAVGGTVHSMRSMPARPWVHISNLEAKLGDERERQQVASLLEKLLLMDVAGSRVRLIVTSNVDPVFHFDSVLFDERRKIYEHPMPEPELQRWARLLHSFRKVRTPGLETVRPQWAETDPGQEIYEECRLHPALLGVGEQVAAFAPANARRDVILAMIADRARALYKLFWASCTRSEKLLLIQVAQTGLVNPLCYDTLEDLVRKGLILPGPRPRIMNETFRRFLQTVERPDAIRQWESEGGESSWLIIRNVVLVLIVLGMAVLALTQQQALQTVSAVLTGVGAVLAGLFRLLGYFTRKGSAASESPSLPA